MLINEKLNVADMWLIPFIVSHITKIPHPVGVKNCCCISHGLMRFLKWSIFFIHRVNNRNFCHFCVDVYVYSEAKNTTGDDEYTNKTKSVNYYGMAHTRQEIVTEQPSIMANGTLKAYQVSWGLCYFDVIV